MNKMFEQIRGSAFAKKIMGWVNGVDAYGLDRLENFDRYSGKSDSVPASGKSVHEEYTFRQRLHDFILNREESLVSRFQGGFTLFFAVLIIGCFLIATSELPSFGDPDNPINNMVSRRYIEKGLEETGGVNIVGGMILDYRAFDTLGESHVLFIAVSAVLILLRNDRKKKGKSINDVLYEPVPDLILQKVAALQIPMILMFGIYIIMNGHISPGGGFSGGTVMGIALTLYYNAYGSERMGRFFTYKTFNRICVLALAFYAFAKGYVFFTGANGLETGIGLGTPGAILSAGLILPLNIAVGLIVACTMFGFFSLFSREVI